MAFVVPTFETRKGMPPEQDKFVSKIAKKQEDDMPLAIPPSRRCACVSGSLLSDNGLFSRALLAYTPEREGDQATEAPHTHAHAHTPRGRTTARATKGTQLSPSGVHNGE